MAHRNQRQYKDPLIILRSVFMIENFRPAQRKAIDTVLSGRDCLVLLPTGGGKSLCYQLPAVCKEGLAVVVSPLLALMQDQVASLKAKGIKAAALSSAEDAAERAMIVNDLRSLKPQIKILYVTPEGVATNFFRGLITQLGNWDLISLVAIDEAHCISEWGHEFRRQYRRLAELRNYVGNAPFIALTATATRDVKNDIIAKLGMQEAEVVQSSFDRPNIEYHFRSEEYVTATGGTKISALEGLLESMKDQCGIIYCFMRQTVDNLASYLNSKGIKCAGYHAGLEQEEKTVVQRNWLAGVYPIIVATIAFGMGIDNPSVRFVIHFDPPKSVESFYQESGRAGRDGLPAKSIVFYSVEHMRKMAGQMSTGVQYLQPSGIAGCSGSSERLGTFMELMIQPECRRKNLLAYFGESMKKRPDRCCDYCLAPNLAEATHTLLMTGKLGPDSPPGGFDGDGLSGGGKAADQNMPSFQTAFSVMGVPGQKTKGQIEREMKEKEKEELDKRFGAISEEFSCKSVRFKLPPVEPRNTNYVTRIKRDSIGGCTYSPPRTVDINVIEVSDCPAATTGGNGDDKEVVMNDEPCPPLGFPSNSTAISRIEKLISAKELEAQAKAASKKVEEEKPLPPKDVRKYDPVRAKQLMSNVKRSMEALVRCEQRGESEEKREKLKMKTLQASIVYREYIVGARKEQGRSRHSKVECISSKREPKTDTDGKLKQTDEQKAKEKKRISEEDVEYYLKLPQAPKLHKMLSDAVYGCLPMKPFREINPNFRQRCDLIADKLLRVSATSVAIDKDKGKDPDFDTTVEKLSKALATCKKRLPLETIFSTSRFNYLK